MTTRRLAHAAGIATVAADGTILDAWFPAPALGARPAGQDPWIVPADLEPLVDQAPAGDELRAVSHRFVNLEIDLDTAPATTEDAYLRLHLLSHRAVRPGEANLDGIHSVLPNLVWTSLGPVLPETYAARLPLMRRRGIAALSVDRFPRLTDYVLPSGVRIADTARVRLGAYLAPGTNVMGHGSVSFDAGTLGPATIAGRIPRGVAVGAGAVLGGGASIAAPTGGAAAVRPWIGERALLGANSGTGIALGDDSVIEAGLYVTPGTKVLLTHGRAGSNGDPVTVRAAELSGAPGLLFRRNSATGTVEALPRD